MCPFVLVRVAEKEPGPQRLLVRSAHDASEPRLLAAVTAEVRLHAASGKHCARSQLTPLCIRMLQPDLALFQMPTALFTD